MISIEVSPVVYICPEFDRKIMRSRSTRIGGAAVAI